ncbi:MAG: SMP-30/gluconolactonase/LRE family protein [Phenylobacterium sp.]
MTEVQQHPPGWERRALLAAAFGAAASAAVAAPKAQKPPPVSPDATPRNWAGDPLLYPDPDIVALDAKFGPYIVWNTPIKRLYTGTLWAEGPAWNGPGRFLVWSDIPGDMQLRWIEDDGRVTTFRKPSGYSNGNTFDHQGRQLSCEHGGRRVVRYEVDGTVTVVADRFEGKRLSSPNDVVVHPDGGIWFTDPPYGIGGNYEGSKAEQELKEAVYRVDPSGRIDKVTDEIDKPNGLCFSPDYRRLYVSDTGRGGDISVFDVDGGKARNRRRFVALDVPGTGAATYADGIRCDRDGNVWAAAKPGVQVFTPEGQRIGMIRLPETSGNLCFGGPKRNRLFITASQSLYSLYVGTSGAHIA